MFKRYCNYLPVQVRTISALATVPSLNIAVAVGLQLAVGAFGGEDALFLLIVRLKSVTEPLPPAIFGIVATDLRP